MADIINALRKKKKPLEEELAPETKSIESGLDVSTKEPAAPEMAPVPGKMADPAVTPPLQKKSGRERAENFARQAVAAELAKRGAKAPSLRPRPESDAPGRVTSLVAPGSGQEIKGEFTPDDVKGIVRDDAASVDTARQAARRTPEKIGQRRVALRRFGKKIREEKAAGFKENFARLRKFTASRGRAGAPSEEELAEQGIAAPRVRRMGQGAGDEGTGMVEVSPGKFVKRPDQGVLPGQYTKEGQARSLALRSQSAREAAIAAQAKEREQSRTAVQKRFEETEARREKEFAARSGEAGQRLEETKKGREVTTEQAKERLEFEREREKTRQAEKEKDRTQESEERVEDMTIQKGERQEDFEERKEKRAKEIETAQKKFDLELKKVNKAVADRQEAALKDEFVRLDSDLIKLNQLTTADLKPEDKERDLALKADLKTRRDAAKAHLDGFRRMSRDEREARSLEGDPDFEIASDTSQPIADREKALRRIRESSTGQPQADPAGGIASRYDVGEAAPEGQDVQGMIAAVRKANAETDPDITDEEIIALLVKNNRITPRK